MSPPAAPARNMPYSSGTPPSRGFPRQAQATVGVWIRMNETLMKSISRRELAPVAHRITDVASRAAAGGRNHPIALNTESVRARALVLDLAVNFEAAVRSWFIRLADSSGHCH